MKKLVTAPHGLHGSLTVPGDKSISHRAVMFGSISKGKTVIHHFWQVTTVWEVTSPTPTTVPPTSLCTVAI